MVKLLTKTEKKVRIRTAKRKKYIEEKLIPQNWFFKKINESMVWIEKIIRKNKYE